MKDSLIPRFRRWLLDNYRPGDRLPDEFELAERFSVSRSTIREAICLLEGLGILERNPRRGTYVKSPSVEEVGNTLQLQLQFCNFGFEEMKQTRLFLELAMAEQLIEKITPADIDRLNGLIQQMEASESELEKADNLDLQFHQALMSISGNHILEVFCAVIQLMFSKKYRKPYLNVRTVRKSVKGHRRMMQSIKAGDAAALKREIERHIKPMECADQP